LLFIEKYNIAPRRDLGKKQRRKSEIIAGWRGIFNLGDRGAAQKMSEGNPGDRSPLE
jgi:hypothetical protein